jgi:nitrate/nitrite transport system substrate-binding protein
MKSKLGTLAICLVAAGAAQAQDIEKKDLTLGFIKLTDMAPLAIALEKGFFADEGLNVTLTAKKNWDEIQTGVLDGSLDAAHMLAGLPIASVLDDDPVDLVAPMSLDLNGNAITVANWIWAEMLPNVPKGADGKLQHPISAAALLPLATVFKEESLPLDFSMVHRYSDHNYELRYWLAAGGLNPGYYAPDDTAEKPGQILADVFLAVTPPPELPKALQSDLIFGYAVGEPWNQTAVQGKFGVAVITDHEIMPFNPEKVLGLRADFVEQNPNTTRALVRALIRAGMWLDADNQANRAEAVTILARSSMNGTFEFEPGDVRPAPEFNLFFDHFATYPYYSDAVWLLTQMRRWGDIPEGQADAWYDEVARKVYRPDIYLDAARSLVDDSLAAEADFPWDTDGYRPPEAGMIDGVTYDGKTPNAYIDSLALGLKGQQRVVGGEVKD